MFLMLFNEDDSNYRFKFRDGLNTDNTAFDCVNYHTIKGGYHFTDEKNVCRYLNSGIYIRELEIPGNVRLSKSGDKFHAISIILKPRRPLYAVTTWEWMKSIGVDFKSSHGYALTWAESHEFNEVVNYLKKELC